MAYELYITRPPHFASPQRRKITWEEWQAVLCGEPELHPVDPEDLAGLPGLDTPAEGLVVRYRPGPGENEALLAFRDGNIVCRNPDEPTVVKLVALAEKLHGQVQGEDGELHRNPAERPSLVQGEMFELASWRLRVRFPRAYEVPSPSARDAALDAIFPTGEDPQATQNEAAVAALAEGAGKQDGQPEPTITTYSANARRVLGRMSVPFPNEQRKPSAAIEGLLNPLRQQ